jgi:hypothetical protein
MSQIDSDKKLLERIARQINNFEPTDEDWPERLRDIASRLGKLDGWKLFRPDLTTYGGFIIRANNKKDYCIDHQDLLASIPDELTKPETPAQKYERITGKEARQHIGDPYGYVHTEYYVAWLEAGQPDTWKGE